MWSRNILTLLTLATTSLCLFPPVADPSAFEKYEINYVTPQYWEQSVMNNETFLESGKIVTMGQDLKCFVSNDTKMSTLQELQSDKENFQRVLNDTLDLGVDIVKGILPDQCIGYRLSLIHI